MNQIARWLCVPVTIAALAALTLGHVHGQATTGTIKILQGDLGRGTITSDPAGITCTAGPDGLNGNCSATFEAGTKVRLKADAARGSKFLGWATNSSAPRGRP